MDNPEQDVMKTVLTTCRRAEMDRVEGTPAAANMREVFCVQQLGRLGFSVEEAKEKLREGYAIILSEEIEVFEEMGEVFPK
jgi:hypothetical protein